MIDATLSRPDFHGTVTAAGGPAAAADDAPPVDPPGYALLGEVGRGGMGVVFRARDLALNREVAVKLLRPGTGSGSAAAARFVEEAQVTGQLQHPGIPAVYQVGALPDGRPFLAMKLIRGRTLDELLKAGAAVDVPAVFESICQAVGYAHAHGVIHRDLKPHNVMVGAFGEVQVMDWGLARVGSAERGVRNDGGQSAAVSSIPHSAFATPHSNLTQHGSVLGTLAYMPPEQAAGDIDRLGPPADVFGLGAILCVLLTGQPPYTGDTLDALLATARDGNTADALARLDRCGADPELIALGKRCLARDPADRPATGDAVAKAVADLRRAADDRAKRAEVERAADGVRAAEQSRRRKLVRRATAAVVAVLAAGVAVSLWQAAVAKREAFDAETARQAEAGERARAAARLDKAVEAVERMVTRAGTARWARDPSLAAERPRVLAEAIAFYEGFGEANDPTIRRETARAYRRIGAVYLVLGDYPKAAEYLSRARASGEALIGEFPEEPKYLADLAEACLFAAHEASVAGRSADALTAYRDATAAARRAAAANPTDDEARRTLASCLIGYGFLAMPTDAETAGGLFRELVGQVDALLARPVVPFATRALASYAYASVSTFDIAQGRVPDGLAHLKRAAELHAATPPDPAAASFDQNLFDMTGGLLQLTEANAAAATDPARAAPLFRRAAETFDKLRAAAPRAFQYRLYQVLILTQEIQLLVRLGRAEEVRKRRAELLAADEAVAASAGPLGRMSGMSRSSGRWLWRIACRPATCGTWTAGPKTC